MKGFYQISFCIVVLISVFCMSAPQPAVVPAPDDWTINVSFEHPQQIVLRLPGGAKPKRFWYTIITLVNRTLRDVDFYPKCELMTDTFQIIPAGTFIPAKVFEKIKQRHADKYPFLEPLEAVNSKILQGLDNAKDIAIIWPDFSSEAKNIRIFISGLSNETAVVMHPLAKDKDGKALKVYLRKTLELSYGIGGDPALRSSARIKYKGKSWIMR